MAFYKDAKPKKMTKQDHLRQMSKWEDEGERYHKSARGENEYSKNGRRDPQDAYSRPFSPKNSDRRPGGYGEHRSPAAGPAPAFRAAPAKPGFSKPAPVKPAPARPAPVKPAPAKPAPFTRPFEDVPENLLSGRNPIREAIKAGRDIEKLLVAKGELSGSAREIVEMAREARIPVQIVERARLDEITHNHQGMLAYASAYRYFEVSDMLNEAREKGEDPFLIILDGVTDPQNLGAIIRTAACVGAHGVIVPERRAVGLTPVAVKASAGAIELIKVARVTNLTRTLEMLKKEGIWLYAADMHGENFRHLKMDGPVALVIGSEGEGVSRLVMEHCDYTVALPMTGKLDSLNASVAAGVLMYAVDGARHHD